MKRSGLLINKNINKYSNVLEAQRCDSFTILTIVRVCYVCLYMCAHRLNGVYRNLDSHFAGRYILCPYSSLRYACTLIFTG